MIESEKEKRNKKIWGVISPIIAVLTVFALLKQNEDVSPREIFESVKAADKVWLSAAGIAAFLYVLFEGRSLRTILKSAGYKCKWRSGLLYAAADVYFSAITPSASGGQPASAYFMTQDGIPGGIAAAALILNLMMYTVSVVALGVIAVIISPQVFVGFSVLSKVLIVTGAVVLTLLSVGFFCLLLNGRFIFSSLRGLLAFLKSKSIVRRAERFNDRLDKAESDYSSCTEIFSKDHGLLIKAFVWNFLQRASQIAVPALIYMAFAGSPKIAGVIFSKQCLITIGFNFVPIPGAMGVADYLMIDGFSDILGKNAALTLEMLSRSMTFYICVTASALITLTGRHAPTGENAT